MYNVHSRPLSPHPPSHVWSSHKRLAMTTIKWSSITHFLPTRFTVGLSEIIFMPLASHTLFRFLISVFILI